MTTHFHTPYLLTVQNGKKKLDNCTETWRHHKVYVIDYVKPQQVLVYGVWWHYVVRVKHTAVLNSMTAFMFTSVIRHAKCIIISKSHPVESKIYCILLLHYFVLINLLVNLHYFALFCLQLSTASGSAAICTTVVYMARYSPTKFIWIKMRVPVLSATFIWNFYSFRKNSERCFQKRI